MIKVEAHAILVGRSLTLSKSKMQVLKEARYRGINSMRKLKNIRTPKHEPVTRVYCWRYTTLYIIQLIWGKKTLKNITMRTGKSTNSNFLYALRATDTSRASLEKTRGARGHTWESLPCLVLVRQPGSQYSFCTNSVNVNTEKKTKTVFMLL